MIEKLFSGLLRAQLLISNRLVKTILLLDLVEPKIQFAHHNGR